MGPVTVEVIKTFDPSYAREVFDAMDDSAKAALFNALEIGRKHVPENIPNPARPEYDHFLWEELAEDSLEDARQYPKQYSFFVVSVSRNGKSEDRYVSADWPSAETFARAELLR